MTKHWLSLRRAHHQHWQYLPHQHFYYTCTKICPYHAEQDTPSSLVCYALQHEHCYKCGAPTTLQVKWTNYLLTDPVDIAS